MRQNFSRLDCSVHEVVSTYTSVSITKGVLDSYGSENNLYGFVKGWAQSGFDVMEKMGIFFC